MQPENCSWIRLHGLTGWDKPKLEVKQNFSSFFFKNIMDNLLLVNYLLNKG